MASLPLSRGADPADLAEWPEAAEIVEAHWDGSQHPLRKWEYALALQAILQWSRGRSLCPREILDVGGAGSPFCFMAVDLAHTEVIDPKVNGLDLAQWIAARHQIADVVTCLSVLEHIPVDDLGQVCYHLACLVAPGGLLVLTVDCAPTGTTDGYHFHWMREQIFDARKLRRVQDTFKPLGLVALAPPDYQWRGAHVYDYSFASLVLTKRP